MPHICHLQNSIICIFPESSSEDVFDEQSSLLSSILGKKNVEGFYELQRIFHSQICSFFHYSFIVHLVWYCSRH